MVRALRTSRRPPRSTRFPEYMHQLTPIASDPDLKRSAGSRRPDREAGQSDPFIQRELVVVFPHGNTLSWCCTSFVNSRLGVLAQNQLRALSHHFGVRQV